MILSRELNTPIPYWQSLTVSELNEKWSVFRQLYPPAPN